MLNKNLLRNVKEELYPCTFIAAVPCMAIVKLIDVLSVSIVQLT